MARPSVEARLRSSDLTPSRGLSVEAPLRPLEARIKPSQAVSFQAVSWAVLDRIVARLRPSEARLRPVAAALSLQHVTLQRVSDGAGNE